MLNKLTCDCGETNAKFGTTICVGNTSHTLNTSNLTWTIYAKLMIC